MKYVYVEELKSNQINYGIFMAKLIGVMIIFSLPPYATTAIFFQRKNICKLNFHIHFPLTRTKILLLKKRLLMLFIGLIENESAGQGRLPIYSILHNDMIHYECT